MNHFRPSNVFLLREEVCRDGQNICEQQQQYSENSIGDVRSMVKYICMWRVVLGRDVLRANCLGASCLWGELSCFRGRNVPEPVTRVLCQ